MIRAFCNQCGTEIRDDVPAGVRLVVGKREVSYHLCPMHQAELLGFASASLKAHPWREVK